ncbi:MAG: 50S ribosomal protein L9 [Candidatus Azosocius agrarius]|nr:MAG: 50S ribosomal protein L9 [Gammaproteobacteria bacterium]
MEIILLTKINNLGNFGDTIKVKSGYARNYLIPKKKAIVANKTNITYYEKEKNKILEQEKIKDLEIEKKINQLQNINIKIISKASSEGKLYGSVKITDIIKNLKEMGIFFTQKELKLKTNIKNIGMHTTNFLLFNTKELNLNIEVIKE